MTDEQLKGRGEGKWLSPRRLIDMDTHVGGSEWAMQLLHDAAPRRQSPERKQRVAHALGQRTSRRVPFLLRPVIVMGVAGCAAIASAALGHWPAWIEQVHRRLSPAAPVEMPMVNKPRTGRTAANRGVETAVVATSPVPAVTNVTATPASTASGSSASTSAARPTRRIALVPSSRAHAASLPVATPPPPPSNPPAASSTRIVEDTGPVERAMRALRVDRDPVRARALASRYLDQNPNGALAEEALAIAIEAAAAHQDRDAAMLGQRYLRLYPSGPFRARATKTVGAAAPAEGAP